MLSVIDELGNVGGLSELALGAGFVVFFIILAPFRDLESSYPLEALHVHDMAGSA